TVADNVYSVSVSGSTVTNTFNREVPPEPTDGGEITPNANGKIVVQKLWKGADGAEIAWPEGATVTLHVVKVADGSTATSITLDSAEPVEVSDLDPAASYTLVEDGAVNGEITVADNVYSVSVSGSTVTNTFNREVPPEPVEPNGNTTENPGGNDPNTPGSNEPKTPGSNEPGNPGGTTPDGGKRSRGDSLAMTGATVGRALGASGLLAMLGIVALGAMKRRED
ncbi:MAG: hypothetical protein MSA58_03405, partial [Schaalia hyovaginalis]|nr:hypothetical protein [Schaalia hyovaginalis]